MNKVFIPTHDGHISISEDIKIAQKTDNGVNKNNTSQNNTNTSRDTSKASENIKSIGKKVDGSADIYSKNVGKYVKTGSDYDSLKKKAETYRRVNIELLTSKLTACEEIYKDYMKIIKYHVSSKVGKKNAEEMTAKKGTDYKQNINTPENVVKLAEKYRNAKPSEKEKIRSDFFNAFKTENPNFTGDADEALNYIPKTGK